MKIGKFFFGAAVLAIVVVGLLAETGGWSELLFAPSFNSGATPGASPLGLPAAAEKQNLSVNTSRTANHFPPGIPEPIDSADRMENPVLQFRAGGHILGFTPEGVLIASGTHALKVTFVGSSIVQPVSENDSSTDGSSEQKENPTFSKVSYPGLWAGITLKYEADASGVAKSTYEIAPGGDPTVIRLKANVPVQIDQNGFLHYGFETGEMIESKPVAWQEINGQKVNIEAGYQIADEKGFGFKIGPYDRTVPLVIDPTLTWNTFLGKASSHYDYASSVAYSASGIYVVGSSDGTWGSPIRSYAGGSKDMFVVKYSLAGARLWNTFLGGTEADGGCGIALDTMGNVYVSGDSRSSWGTPVRVFSGANDVFIAKLNAGGVLQWNTFQGGTGEETGGGIAVDVSGNSYVTGASAASWGSPVRAFEGGTKDAFAAKVNTSGALQWNTFLGGSGGHLGNAIAFSTYSSGRVYVTGSSTATWGTPVRAFTGTNADAFVVMLNSSTGALIWLTFLGSSSYESGFGVAVTSAGIAYVSGNSEATWGTVKRAYTAASDGFAAKLDAAGALQWNTFLGGAGADDCRGLFLDSSENLYIVGNTPAYSWGTPVHAFGGVCDAFEAKVNSSGILQWNTFIGGSNQDWGRAIAGSSAGAGVVVGECDGTFGTSPISPFSGGYDAFFATVSSTGVSGVNSFIGASGYDEGSAVAVDGAGNVYVAGLSTASWGTPVRAFDGGFNNVFVAKLNASGALQWNTFFGGASKRNYCNGLAVSASGSAYISGTSLVEWGTPVRSFSGIQAAFVVRLNANGALLWNTFLGGSVDYGRGIAVDTSGNTYVTGNSNWDWGTTPVRPRSSGNDAFAAKLNSAGTLQWNTFLGGAGADNGVGIDVDTSGNVYIAGTSFATWGDPVRAYSAMGDAFAAKLDASGVLQWNTFLGASGSDAGGGIAVYGTSAVYLVGSSFSTWGNPVRAYSAGGDAFVAKLNTSGALQWNTFLGSSEVDLGIGVEFDGSGNLFVGGDSYAAWGTPSRAYSGTPDVFAAMLNPSGILQWNGFFGSSQDETGGFIAADSTGIVYIAGTGNHTWGSPIGTYGGGTDAWAAKITNEFPATIAVTSPNGGESWPAGSVHNLTWSSTGTLANVKIDYSTDSGGAWTPIIASTPNDGTYAWTVPNTVSSTCRIRVSDAVDGSPSDTSNADFSIIAGGASTIALSKTSLNFGAERNGTPTPGQTTLLTNSGGGTMNWTAIPSVGWLQVDPASGTGDAVLTITVTNTNYSVGTYAGTIAIAAVGATNTPQTITVSLKVIASGSDAAPFGNFATPADGSTVMSSVPVTGWVLDDVYVQSVKIYRGNNMNDRVYIGDATFVDGARPDVAKAYSTYPMNYRAGWGYMLLTNFLPNKGNGPFTLLAYAMDSKGHEVLLGSKAITCDNAHAVKPFGAIDTPSQGGTATGDSFVNFGWALTPLPDSIATNGSTINVYVDSVPLGHPTYNIYRKDIATAFPGLNNSSGAIGYFYLNTTTMTNGVHTIQWSVTDTGGQGDGIGSRYFTVQNLSGGSSEGAEATAEFSKLSTGRRAEDLFFIPEDRRTPIYLKRGVREDAATEAVYPETEGNARIAIQPLERIAVYWNENDSYESREEGLARARRILFKTEASDEGIRYEAYQLVMGELRPLPIGASFDPKDGIFYWQPGPGFLGEFAIVLVRNDGASLTRKTVTITIEYLP